jgi:hypothetical protein
MALLTAALRTDTAKIPDSEDEKCRMGLLLNKTNLDVMNGYY